jgi:hypothetical protein
MVFDPTGTMVADSVLTVDRDTALLQGMVSTVSYARWLLHTAIVERLCGECALLLTNSDDVMFLNSGQQHFQRLLGYSIVRIRLRRTLPELLSGYYFRTVAMCLGGAALVVAAEFAPPVTPSLGERALIWLTALVGVRWGSQRAGLTTATGGLAAAAVLACREFREFETPRVALAYLLAGISVDVVFALLQRLRLTWSWMRVAVIGAGLMVVTLVGPEFPTLGHHGSGVSWPVPPLLAAGAFGSVAAVMGWLIGKRLFSLTAVRPRGHG